MMCPHACDAPVFVCECATDEPRRLCVVEDYAGEEALVRYCPECIELARVDWNGETKSIRVVDEINDADPSRRA